MLIFILLTLLNLFKYIKIIGIKFILFLISGILIHSIILYIYLLNM